MINVVNWAKYPDSEDEDEYTENEFVGGLGGWFGTSDGDRAAGRMVFSCEHRWCDYIEKMGAAACEYNEALRIAIVERYKTADAAMGHHGQHHQYGRQGVPVFSDGTVGLFTYRAWGDLMAAIWTEEKIKSGDDIGYCYMDFYM